MKVVKDFVRPPSGKGASVALGLFDGLHIGHRQVLEAALHSGELAPCVFTYTISSQIPQNKKNYSTLMPDEQKCALLEQMGFEMVVMPEFDSFKDVEPREFVERMLIEGMGARELSCGYDFTFGKKGAGDTRLLSQVAAEHGVGLNIIQPVLLDGKPVSSTRIRQAILDGRMDDASRMLGRRFCIRLKVEHGNQIGRMLDFPTINQVFPRFHIVPRYGVYSTIVNIDGKLYGGVTNVGVKPTVGSDGPLAETYILDFSGDYTARPSRSISFALSARSGASKVSTACVSRLLRTNAACRRRLHRTSNRCCLWIVWCSPISLYKKRQNAPLQKEFAVL